MKKHHIFLLLILPFLFTSCMSKKKIVYLQGSQKFESVNPNYDPLIQNDDRLSILVSSLEIQAAAPFNLNQNQVSGASTTATNGVNNSYLVDVNGNIDFPVLGTLNVSGYSIEQLKSVLKEKISVYVKNPVINISILNFKVTVLGDVGSPGIKSFSNHRVTLLDAIAASGDLTIYGKRKNIMIIRDFQGLKSFNRVDITQADFVNSPFYYLDQNDVIYVEQRKAKIDSTSLPNLPLIVSVISFLTTVVLLVTK